MYACLSFIVVNINTVINVAASGKKTCDPYLETTFLVSSCWLLISNKIFVFDKIFPKNEQWSAGFHCTNKLFSNMRTSYLAFLKIGGRKYIDCSSSIFIYNRRENMYCDFRNFIMHIFLSSVVGKRTALH